MGTLASTWKSPAENLAIHRAIREFATLATALASPDVTSLQSSAADARSRRSPQRLLTLLVVPPTEAEVRP